MSKTRLHVSERYKVRPGNIDVAKPFTGAFNSSEARATAAIIVRFCQQRQQPSWAPFSLSDLTRANGSAPQLDKLKASGHVVVVNDVCSLTQEFVEECYMVRPKSM